MTTTNKHEIAFIDQGVDDLDVLTKGIRPDVELFLLINNEPALRQMARAVEGRKGLEAVHIIAHGQPGEIAFSAGLLSLETIDQDRDDLAVLGSVIGEGGELRLWSCAVAQGEHGAAFVHAITNATGAKVAASVRRVGAAARGGSWELSSIEKPTLAPPPITAAGQRAYAGVLDTNNTTISGNNSTNTLSVTGSNDKISDGNGTNSVTVTGNNNTVSDGNGTNTVAVTGNNNTVSDGNGTNTITVSGNNNTISDGNGSNTIIASGSNATISDGNGGNLIYAKDTSGTNSISDGNGSNIIVGGSGTDTISAGNGSNIIYGGAGNDTIKVGNGSDVIMAGAGTDTVTAGNGNDLFIYAISDHYTVVGSQLQSIANDVDTYVAGGGTDTIRIVVTADEYSLMNTQLTGYANWLATHKGSSATYSLNFGTGGGLSLNGFEALQVQIVNPGTINLAAGANSSTGSLNSLNLFSNTVGTSSTNFTDTFKIVGVAAGNAGASATTLDPSLAVAKYLDGTATLPTSYTVHGADGTLTVNADGTYSYTVTSHVSLSDTFTLTTLDQNGFVTSTTLTFGVPNLAAPIVTLTHDTAGAGTGGTASDHLTKDGSLTVSGAVGTTITYAVDGGAFSASYNPAALADGSHTVDVKLTDQAGNTADTSINFTLDTTTAAPTVVLTNDTARAGTSGTSSDHLTKDASLSVSGTEAGAAITYAVDGGAFTASYDPTSLADGGHTVDVKSTDQAGNTADTSISFTLDTTTAAPTVVLTNDTAGAGTSGTASDHLTKDGSLTVSGTEAGAAVSYSVDGAAFTSSYDPTSLADGSHTVDVKSSDQAGNTADTSISFTLDTTTAAPTVVLANDTAGAGTSGTTSDHLTKDASLSVSGTESGAAITYAVDGGAFSATYNPAALADGSHTVDVKSTDQAGNTADTSISFTLDTTTAAPTVALANDTAGAGTSGTSSDHLTKDASLSVSGTEAGAAITYSIDGGSFNASYDPTSLADGNHTVDVRSTDQAGNTADTSISFTLDTTTAAPTVALTNDTAGAGTAGTSSDHLTSDASLTVSGQENGAAITYAVDGGAFSASYDPTSLADGNHTVDVRSTDQAGNTADTSISFTLDTTTAAPTVALANDTAGAGTVGTSTDHLTKDASLSVSGTEAGAGITYSIDGGSFTSSYDPTSLSDGSHTVDVKSTDQAGNTADTSISFTLDTTTVAPTVALTNDTAGAGTAGTSSDHLTKGASLSVSGTESGAAVTYSVDGAAFTSSYDPTSLSDGSHTVDVKSIDQAGNTADTSISFTLDTTTVAPTVVLANDTAGAGTAGTSSDHLTKDASLSVSGTESGAAVTYSVDGAAFTSSYDPTSLADGSHTVDVKSTDQAGNTADTSTSFTLDTTTVAPTVALTNDTAGAGTAGTSSDHLTSDASLTVSGQENGAAITYAVDGGAFSATYNPAALADGTHTVDVKSTDQAGNTADTSISFTLDTTTAAPTVALTNDTAGAGTSGTSSDHLTSDASLTVSGQENGAAITYAVDGGAFSASYNPAALADGNHTVDVKSTDQAGNTADTSISLTLDTTTAAPTVALTNDTAGAGTSGTSSDHLTKDASLSVSGTEAGAAITYAVDGGAFSASYDPTSLADGSHTVDVKSTDQAGNTADTSISFTLDTTTAAPTVVLANDTAGAGTSGTSSDHLTKDAALSVSGTEAGAAITYSIDGGSFNASYDPTSLADGSHTVDVKSTDQAGNTADTSISFTLDTTTAAPTVVLTNDTAGAGTSGTASDHLTSDASLTVSGQENGAAITYAVDGGAFSASYNPAALADGSHTVDVKSTDQAGNTADTSISFTLDTTTAAPTVVLANDSAGAGTSGTTSDHLTKDASLSVSGTESGAAITYAVDGGAFSATYNPAALADGSHTVDVKSTDQAGNTADTSISFTLDTTTAAPTVVLANDTAGAGTSGTSSDHLTKDASLSVSGTEAGAAVSYSVDGAAFIASYDPTSLADGSHTVDVKSSDQAGNTADTSISFTLDTTTAAPTVVLANDTAGAGTSGTTSDHLTKDASLSVSGTESGAAITYAVDGGAFSATYNPAALADGSHTVDVKSTDQAGNTADTSISFTLDTTTAAPTVALANDTAGAGTSGTSSDHLTKDASLSVSGTEAGAAITYSIDGGSFNASYDPTSLADGNHTVDVRSTDQAGNTADTSISFTLDTTTAAPTVVLAHDTGTSNADKTTNNAALTVGGTETGAAITYSVDGAAFASSYDPASLADGSHTVDVKSTDKAGNTADTSLAFLIDTTAPTVNSEAITSATGIQNSTLNAGDVVSVTATFSETVTVTGTPQLQLNIGGSLVQANYASGSGSNALVFTYTVQSGQTDTNGISLNANALSLNNGTITDTAGNAATLTAASVADNASYKVDTTAPTVSSEAITSATGIQNSTLNVGDVVSVTATFSETVTVTGTPQLQLNVGGTLVQANYASGSGSNALVFTYTIQSGQTDTNGISLNANALSLNNGTITDTAGNAATLAAAAVADNASYKVDTTAPTVNGEAITSGTGIQNNTLNVGDIVSVTATFSETVTVTGTPQLQLNVGGTLAQANYASGSGSNALVFTYAIQSGQTDANGISLNANALSLNNGTITDAAGNAATLTAATVADNPSYLVDTTAPTVTQVQVSAGRTTGDRTSIVTVTFSEAVNDLTPADVTFAGSQIKLYTGPNPALSGGNFQQISSTVWEFETDQNTSGSNTQTGTLQISGYHDLAGNSGITFSQSNVTLAPAGTAGQLIDLALAGIAPPNADPVTITGIPTGWSLNNGVIGENGTWTVQASQLASTSIISPATFAGATLLHITATWSNPDGSMGSAIIKDNVEAYASGSPIFAWSGDDTLTGSGGHNTFVFSQAIGHDVVHSFEVSSDVIDLISYGWQSFGDVQAHTADDASGNAVITLATGQTITLDGVHAADLTAANFAFDATPTTENPGPMTIGDGAMLPLSGIIDNTGEIDLEGSGDDTLLQLIQTGVTLKGGGHVNLSDDDHNIIAGTAPDVTLDNIDNVISGAGQIGQGSLTLSNEGSIIATGIHALVLDTGSHVIANAGTLEATGPGGLVLESAVTNNGLIWANGGTVTALGAVTGTGTALISGAGSIEFGAGSTANTSFDASATGHLILDDAFHFTGTVSGLDGNDDIDIKGISFGAGTAVSFAENQAGTGGTLTVSDGAHTANIVLLGQYDPAGFAEKADTTNGTVITYDPHHIA